MNNFDEEFTDLNDRIFTRYERARVLLGKLSTAVRDLAVPLYIYARFHKDEEIRKAISELIETPVELAEVFDLLIKTDMVDMMNISIVELARVAAELDDMEEGE